MYIIERNQKSSITRPQNSPRNLPDPISSETSLLTDIGVLSFMSEAVCGISSWISNFSLEESAETICLIPDDSSENGLGFARALLVWGGAVAFAQLVFARALLDGAVDW